MYSFILFFGCGGSSLLLLGSLVVVCRLLTVVSPPEEHGLQGRRASVVAACGLSS